LIQFSKFSKCEIDIELHFRQLLLRDRQTETACKKGDMVIGGIGGMNSGQKRQIMRIEAAAYQNLMD